MDDSVFYPGPPVFRGATFIDAISDDAAGEILSRFGRPGVADFFCFMLQVHETVHSQQTGEPLLNEVIQAALWSRFLSEESLWNFQSGTNGPLVREALVVEHFPELVDAAVKARLDSARMIAAIATDNAYFPCCLLAHRFDSGMIRYSDYLAQLDNLLANRQNTSTIREITYSTLNLQTGLLIN